MSKMLNDDGLSPFGYPANSFLGVAGDLTRPPRREREGFDVPGIAEEADDPPSPPPRLIPPS